MSRTAALILALVALALSSPAPAGARVLNVEFKFTPFTGDAAKDDVVATVPGVAHVVVNGIPIADQDVAADTLPVLFEAREIAPAVWLPVESLGSILRRGTNTLKIVFEPTDPAAKYKAQLRWAAVTDDVAETNDGAGRSTATNQAAEGVDAREATGALVMERSFDAPFAADRPWHHAKAETALSAADRAALAAIVEARLAAFAPDFARVHALLEAGGPDGVDVANVRKLKCLEAAYVAGLRIAGPAKGQLDLVVTGHAVVVIRAKDGPLFRPADPDLFAQVQGGEDVQMCAAAALMQAYPPRLLVVRDPKGGWSIVD